MDYRWIELCEAGDSSAVEHFVQPYQRDVYSLALSILDDYQEAEDATQESLLAASSLMEAHLSPRLQPIPLKSGYAHL